MYSIREVPRSAAMFMLVALSTYVGMQPLFAQSWKPEHSMEIVTGVAPGGPQDRMARVLQKIMQDNKWVDVPIVVNSKPGGGGTVAMAYMNQHQGDGRYLMISAPPLITNKMIGASPYTYTDFTPIAIMGVEYEGVGVAADSPFKTGKDLLDKLKKDPASLSIAIGTAVGNSAHLAFVQAMKAGGVDIKKLKTVAFNSASESITNVIGGHVDVTSSPPSVLMPMVEAGKMRIIAITAPRRGTGVLAQVPTWKELGVNSTTEVWRCLLGPKNMTKAQIAFWDDLLGKLVKTEEWRKELEQGQQENVYRNSTDTAKYWKDEADKMHPVLTELGLAK